MLSMRCSAKFSDSLGLVRQPLVDLGQPVSAYFREVPKIGFRFAQILASARWNVPLGECVQFVDQFRI
jgi:hypothetical protein